MNTQLYSLTTLAHVLSRRRCLAAALCLATMSFVVPPAQAAVVEAWVQRYNGPADNDDYARAVAVDGNGNVVVTGSSYGDTSDYSTAKYAAADGALLWEKRYNGPANGFDDAQAVAVDGSGNVVVTGSSENTNSNADYYTAKYAAADGALLWEKRYDGPSNGFDKAQAVAVDFSGNVVVTGYSFNSSGNRDFYTAKYAAADGALLWEKRYNGPAGDREFGYYGSAVAVDGSGNVMVTGSSWNGSSDDYYTAKYAAADGALLWEQRYNGPANGFDEAQAVAVDRSGNVVVTGNSNFDYYTAKYAAADGTLLWEKRDDGGVVAQAVAVDGSGNVVVTGSDYYTVKHAAADGALLWEKRYNGPANNHHYAQAVAVDGSGNVVVTGWSSSVSAADSDYYTAKYAAADGALLWEKRYNGPADKVDFVGDFVGGSRTLAIGPNGMVAIAGSSDGNFGSSHNFDYATVVYRENLPPVSITLVPAGVRIRFFGAAGRSYNIERALIVTGPWSTIATQTAQIGGDIEYVDTNVPTGATFYRTSTP